MPMHIMTTPMRSPKRSHPWASPTANHVAHGLSVRPAHHPERVFVHDAHDHRLAIFTLGAPPAALSGPVRTFTEARRSVQHGVRVRTYPTPFKSLDECW